MAPPHPTQPPLMAVGRWQLLGSCSQYPELRLQNILEGAPRAGDKKVQVIVVFSYAMFMAADAFCLADDGTAQESSTAHP